jgi:hypothetical protein
MPLTPSQREQWIEQYAAGPARLRAALELAPPQSHMWRPGAGKWTIHEVVIHCADSEVNAHARVRFLLAEEQPVLMGYDQDRWAQVLDYHARPIAPALATIEAVRANTVPLLRALPAGAWDRKGRHTESGP